MGKRIFISDIHMGDSKSVEQSSSGNRYGWFYSGLQAVNVTENRPEMLATFLKEYCLDDRTVDEVIVLGDLFDQWICPVDVPPPDLMSIATASQNVPSIDVLKALAKDGRLWYLPGNHDMLADETLMKNIFGRGLNYIPSLPREEGHNVFYRKEERIWAEHGHWYGLFNAPETESPGQGYSKSILPIGYFVSRIVAEWALNTGKRITPLQILWECVKDHPTGAAEDIDDALAGALAVLVKDQGGGHANVVCNVGGISGSPSWGDVGQHYRHIYSGWNGNIDAVHAAECDAIDLWYPACKTPQDHNEVRIVIFGHTHEQVLWPIDDGISPGSVRRVYANAGAWAYDAKPCTFIETEVVGKKHYVSRKEWFLNETTGRYEAAPLGRYWQDVVYL